jgi:hypothetical protein
MSYLRRMIIVLLLLSLEGLQLQNCDSVVCAEISEREACFWLLKFIFCSKNINMKTNSSQGKLTGLNMGLL